MPDPPVTLTLKRIGDPATTEEEDTFIPDNTRAGSILKSNGGLVLEDPSESLTSTCTEVAPTRSKVQRIDEALPS